MTSLSEVLPPQGPDPSGDAALDIARVVADTAAERRDWRRTHHRSQEPGPRELPSPDKVAEIVTALRGILFPMRLGPADLRQEDENAWIAATLAEVAQELTRQVFLDLRWGRRRDPGPAVPESDLAAAAAQRVNRFLHGLGEIRRRLDLDVVAAFHADPAAGSVDEVLLSYPGIRAIISHRLAHQLHRLGAPLIARLISELAHGETGIDIHPGATIGERFFIDHGTGVVIGATAIIGDRVQIFQAVTLGAKSFPTDGDGHAIKGTPRHPIVEDDVIIYSGATVLGRVTIGRGAVLGGNVWVTSDVPPRTIISQARTVPKDLQADEVAALRRSEKRRAMSSRIWM